MYSDKVIDHFENPRNVGVIDNPSCKSTVGNPRCGDVMRLYMIIDDETKIIKDCKFKTFGCAAAIATSSIATEMIIGKTIYEAVDVTNEAIVEALDGLPSIKIHCSLLAENAIHSALYDYSLKKGVDIPGLKVVNNCCNI